MKNAGHLTAAQGQEIARLGMQLAMGKITKAEHKAAVAAVAAR